MKVHYFQRYHQKENVDTANTMLLLSRFYSYSPNKFYALLKDLLKDDSFNPELYMNIQEKAEKTVPDAVIAQNGFKIVVEAKTSDWFHTDQLVNHLDALKDGNYSEVFQKKIHIPSFQRNFYVIEFC